MTLRPQIDRYVRSLPERAEPEDWQDLSTFLIWLLQRSGHSIRLAPFRYSGPRRRSRSEYQGHVDLVTSLPRLGSLEGSSHDPSLEDRAVEELERVYSEPDGARVLLRRAYFPEQMIPAFSASEVFWSLVTKKARDGALRGGVRPILREAARQYPGNPGFAPFGDTPDDEELWAEQATTQDLFLFVLRHGDVGEDEWSGGLYEDLQALHDTSPKEHKRWLPADAVLGEVNIIIVHNGEFDGQVLESRRKTHQDRLRRDGFKLDWWGASELVDRALAVLGEAPDAQLFPPTIRPYYGVLLDGLQTNGRIEIDGIGRLLDARLPAGGAIAPADLRQLLTELSLFCAMLAGSMESRSTGLLDLIDALLRIIVRGMAKRAEIEGFHGELDDGMAELVAIFVNAGDRLAHVVEALVAFPDGLALMDRAERIDWPLRTSRIVRDLTLATRAAYDLVELAANRPTLGDRIPLFREAAQRCIERSAALAESNLGGLATPITDDQLVEIMITWRTWLDHGHEATTAKVANEMVTRLSLRRRFLAPGPALYLSAGTPMREADARLLAETWLTGQRPPEFEDGGSTLIPVVIFAASRLGRSITADELRMFGPLQIGERQLPPVHLQSWIPPDDAPFQWYGGSLRHTGTCRLHTLTDLDTLLRELPESQPMLPPSPASALGLPSIDAMAWVLWRTRPPLRWLLDRLPPAPVGTPDPAEQDSKLPVHS